MKAPKLDTRVYSKGYSFLRIFFTKIKFLHFDIRFGIYNWKSNLFSLLLSFIKMKKKIFVFYSFFILICFQNKFSVLESIKTKKKMLIWTFFLFLFDHWPRLQTDPENRFIEKLHHIKQTYWSLFIILMIAIFLLDFQLKYKLFFNRPGVAGAVL